jgi:hypothetical protein
MSEQAPAIVGIAALRDPEANEFCILRPRP